MVSPLSLPGSGVPAALTAAVLPTQPPPSETAALCFNPETLAHELAAASQPAAWLRQRLRESDDRFQQLFLDGVPASDLVPARARLMDQALLQVWQRFFPTATTELLALVAVGGYGRGELHPGSDVDILILLDTSALDFHRTDLEQFLTFLWDAGLDVGHSVRTVEECVHEGAADITVATSLMESRRLAGSTQLFEQMRAVTGPDRIWPDADFFEAKQQERLNRCRKQDATAFNLEPNIKEGPGGLRDLHLIGWVAKRHFGASTLWELVHHGFLTASEYDALIIHRNWLWQIRFALHALTGRREDQLLFDHQRQVAQQLGYRDQAHTLAVEQFMQHYYRTVNALGQLTEMLLQLFEEAILLAHEPDQPVAINRRFQAQRGYVEVIRDDVFLRQPFALLEIFLLLQQHPELKGLRASTIRLIREQLPRLHAKFRHGARSRRLFLKILCQPRSVTQQLRMMNSYGVLSAYLPEFALIVGRMQYDLFHVYTVDQHTLFVVRNLRRFTLAAYAAETPRCHAIMQGLRPELLYIAGLYHDIAKGRGGDHSVLGAKDAEQFCDRHGLGPFDTRLVAWLVRHHLTLSVTSQKKDIHDPAVIHDFAGLMGDQMHLDYLYLLTVADIRATNPKLWNTWRDSLLWQLYQATRQALRRGLEHPIHRDQRIREVQQQARQQLGTRLDPAQIEPIWERFGDDYFLRHTADEVVWHTRAILKHAQDERPLVMARDDPQRGGLDIFIHTLDQDNLFALITSRLDQLRLTVLDARILTAHNGYALDSFTVLEDSGAPVREPERIKEITGTLYRVLNQPNAEPVPPSRRISRIQRAFRMPTCATFHEDAMNNRTVVELVSWDRPGLLCRVGQAFMQCGVQLHNAKIATLGERVEDVFFVTDRDNRPLNDPAQYEALRTALVAHLDAE